MVSEYVRTVYTACMAWNISEGLFLFFWGDLVRFRFASGCDRRNSFEPEKNYNLIVYAVMHVYMFRTDDQFVPLINGTPVDQPGTRLINRVPGVMG